MRRHNVINLVILALAALALSMTGCTQESEQRPGVHPELWTNAMLGFPQSEENRGEEESLQRRTDCIDTARSRIEHGDGHGGQHGVAEQTIYRWRRQFSGMEVSDVRELRRLRDENARLKKLLAERDLEVEVMKEIQAKKW